MDIKTTTIAQLLANSKAVEALNAIEPKILRSPMVKLVKGKTVAQVFDMVPDGKVSPEVKAKIKEALEKI
jgi:hypothetical protein